MIEARGALGEDISGLGDAAFYDGLGSLMVLKENIVLGVFIGSSSLPSNDGHVIADEQLARLALSRLSMAFILTPRRIQRVTSKGG